ncbi:MAG: tRNA-dihydrouridine synthase family protein [Lachnospiraceae bacterium]|nr:tRNA-dihydrouridine synthase family protein [Lachnospiraceae bacterium]
MNFELAPLEGVTTHIFRNAFVRHFGGVDTYYAPFVSPHQDKTLNSKERRDLLPENNEGIHLIPQILTASVDDFLSTAKDIEAMGYTEVNLNAGCPSGTVTSKSKGAGMLIDPQKLERFLDGIFEKCTMKISVKTRIGFDSPKEWEDIQKVYEKFPIEELIIHPRVRQDFYKNKPNRETFAQAFATTDMKLSYNGDIFLQQDIEALQQQFPTLENCMIGRGLLINPALLLEYKKERTLDKATLQSFHDEIYENYRIMMGEDRNAMFRMKELWFYMIKSFKDADKYAKAIRKADKSAPYEAAVRAVFRDLDLVEQGERRIIL